MVQGDKLIYGYNDRENALLCSYVRKYGENSEEERIIARCEQGGVFCLLIGRKNGKENC